MAMARVPETAPRLTMGLGRRCATEAATTALLAVVLACGMAGAQAANPSPSSASSSSSTQNQPATDQTQSQTGGSSPSKPHHKPRVVDEDAQPRLELTKAEDFIQKQNYAAAELLLKQVVESEPSNYEAWFDLGFVENALGKVDDSIAAYRKSVAAKPDVFETNLNLGLQLAKTGQPEAEEFLRTATQLKPSSHAAEGKARAWLSLGHLLEKSKPEEALAAYRQAGTLQPKDPEPHLAAGRLLEAQEKYSDAEDEYKQALALAPSTDATAADALTGLANISMRGRRLSDAEAYLRQLVSARPNDAAAHVQLGRVLAAESKNDAAAFELQTGARLAPVDPSAQRDLAEVYSTLGKYDLAEAVYRGLIAAAPNDAELHRDLGHSLVLEKKFPEAQKEFLTAVNLKPDFGEAYGDLAFAAGENKDYALAIKALDSRAKFLPEIPITYFLRASAYDHLKDFRQAALNYHLFLNSANGKYPDQEWQAKHRLVAIEPKK